MWVPLQGGGACEPDDPLSIQFRNPDIAAVHKGNVRGTEGRLLQEPGTLSERIGYEKAENTEPD